MKGGVNLSNAVIITAIICATVVAISIVGKKK